MINYWSLKTEDERKAIIAKSIATRRANKKKREDVEHQVKAKSLELRYNIKQLSEQLEQARKAIRFGEIAKQLDTKSLMREEDIIKHAMSFEKAIGIYFLIENNKIVYVGQSVNVFSRITNHWDKKFDSYAWIPCEKNMLNKLESLYIYFLSPPLNGECADGRKFAPLRLEQLIA
jgi:hypothetical protein